MFVLLLSADSVVVVEGTKSSKRLWVVEVAKVGEGLDSCGGGGAVKSSKLKNKLRLDLNINCQF
jgi:hypothetical protein